MTLLSGGSKMVPHDEQNGQGIMTTKVLLLLLSDHCYNCVCALKMIQYSTKYIKGQDELQQYQHQ